MAFTEQKVSFYNSAGLELAGIVAVPSGLAQPFVLFCHGFGSSKQGEVYQQMAERLFELGIGTLRFDLGGHGESGGALEDVTLTQAIDDLKAALAWVRASDRLDPARLGLYGRSFGGNVAVLYAALYQQVKALVLNAPLVDMIEFHQLRHDAAAIETWRQTGFIFEVAGSLHFWIKYRIYQDALKYNTYDLAARIHCPTLIIHGDADQTVPVHQSLRLAERMGGVATLIIVPGADHNFEGPGEKEHCLERSVQFFQAQLRDT